MSWLCNWTSVKVKLTQIEKNSFKTLCLLSRSGTLVNSIGFEWMLVGISFLCFCYAPLLRFLKNPPTREEKKVSPGMDNLAVTSDMNTMEMAKSTNNNNNFGTAANSTKL